LGLEPLYPGFGTNSSLPMDEGGDADEDDDEDDDV